MGAPLASGFEFTPATHYPESERACDAAPTFHTYVAYTQGISYGTKYSKEYRALVNGSLSPRTAHFFDGCASLGGDGVYEW